LEREIVRAFARGLEEVLVVEEKRAVIENAFKEQLYNWNEAVRPRVIGKFDETGAWILPSAGELTPARIARVIAERIGRFHTSETIQRRLALLQAKEAALTQPRGLIERLPHYCAGCPHNTSTRVPEGSRALAGIGCHYMAIWMDRHTETFTQMGGEGVPWIGQAPFTDTPHVFANLGDGTYYHSGLLAIRAAVAAGVNITYKLLYNDAVAMTGGQPLDGPLSVARISRQVHAEGVRRIVVVSDQPEKYATQRDDFAPGVEIHHRQRFDAVQQALREQPGVSVLIYDQTCAAEKRRRRKRGTLDDPPERVFINPDVCEGCGDCSVQSNCLAVVPLETPFGRKRAIDQSACNKDYSCLEGFCPSFVTLRGARPRRGVAVTGNDLPQPPEPALPTLERPYDIVVTGVGGTGVVTVGAVLGMAAHLEQKGVTVLDMTGLAQKYGAVVSHLRLAERPEDLHAVRIAAGNARLLLGCDLVVAAGAEALAKLDPDRGTAVVNSHESMPAAFTRDPDLRFPGAELRQAIRDAAARAEFLDAGRFATGLLGDAIAVNLFLVGYAWQRGLIPLSHEAIERAIELNGVAVDFNRRAFAWGRQAAHDPAAVESRLRPMAGSEATPQTLEAIIAHRRAHLAGFQNAAYADRYVQRVRRIAALERERTPGHEDLTRTVARAYAKLLAYKDEYEVARLYADGRFRRQLAEQFEGNWRLEFHLAPPLLARRDPVSGRPRKRRFGPWLLALLGLLYRCRGLRGTPLDPFGYSAERRLDRELIADYERLLDTLAERLVPDNHAIAVELAGLALNVRGFGPVREQALAQARAREQELLALLQAPPRPARAA
ncbi:MAG: indolepyruvate ferredoxin oxidoreductase family protein, partial [Candidatus Competibacterales bacterium]|nr:indolepyruvate ferredoxin oxidoreductase family protein [Candidatus Competibacterales bacterium]